MRKQIGTTPKKGFRVRRNDARDGRVIRKYTGPGGAVVIPAEIWGLPVREIGCSTFEGCSSLASVAIPDSVTQIGEDAFRECSNLVTVNISPIEHIWGKNSFDGCSKLSRASHEALKKAQNIKVSIGF
ncbi:MAG: leucine-rich repeat domain-containing protein [Treponema sp.]|jgi:hypothetical protein|nr:leucine-rich repeat domain-containing protein [Treponema sp.]